MNKIYVIFNLMEQPEIAYAKREDAEKHLLTMDFYSSCRIEEIDLLTEFTPKPKYH